MSNYESPDYVVERQNDPFEIRRYNDFYIIEYSDVTDTDAENGFGTLFRYISSNNKSEEKLSMTIPVIQEISKESMKMAFVIPKSNWKNIPEPNSNKLTIKKIDTGLFAVVSYSGRSNHKKEKEMKLKLSDWIEKNSFKIDSNYMLAFYNAPFTPGILRHNEVMVRIKE